jgi:hypothetical protein
MATFDQLAADQRAIIEIVLKQGRSYEQIGSMLDLPPTRVRELARDALGELAPFTADFVDPDWRGQLADYVLGQQTGPEAQATRGHLRRSEPARIWAYSLLDALDDFYAEGDRPDIPHGEAASALRSRVRGRDEGAANGEAPTAALGTPSAGLRGGRAGLSPAARTALLRRRIAGGLGTAVIVALLVFGGLKLFGGDDDKKASGSSGSTTSTSASQADGQGQIVAEAALAPIGSFKGQGAAIVYQSGNQSLLVMRAKLPPSKGNKKYLIWLYNSEKQLAPVAGDVTDKQGNFQGAQALPQGWENFKFIDVTYQSASSKKLRHGTSVMRGPLMNPQPAGAGNSGGSGGSGGGTGTTTTP